MVQRGKDAHLSGLHKVVSKKLGILERICQKYGIGIKDKTFLINLLIETELWKINQPY